MRSRRGLRESSRRARSDQRDKTRAAGQIHRRCLALSVGRCETAEAVKEDNRQEEQIARQDGRPKPGDPAHPTALHLLPLEPISHSPQKPYRPGSIDDSSQPCGGDSLGTNRSPGQGPSDRSYRIRVATAIESRFQGRSIAAIASQPGVDRHGNRGIDVPGNAAIEPQRCSKLRDRRLGCVRRSNLRDQRTPQFVMGCRVHQHCRNCVDVGEMAGIVPHGAGCHASNGQGTR